MAGFGYILIFWISKKTLISALSVPLVFSENFSKHP